MKARKKLIPYLVNMINERSKKIKIDEVHILINQISKKRKKSDYKYEGTNI